MLRTLALTAVIPVVIAVGLLEGRWTDRWGRSLAVQSAADRLSAVPKTLGEWRGQDGTLDARAIEIAEIKGYISRTYIHQGTGAAVSVLIVCGRPGPVSCHTPDVCFKGQGYEPVVEPETQAVSCDALGRSAEFKMANFRNDQAISLEPVRVFWAWNGNGSWQAPDLPRFAFAKYPALYKLYVSRSMAKVDEPLDHDPCLELLQLLLPELQKALFPA